MRPRDPSEDHRASTPLELLFDLCFVVAVAQAAAHLSDGLMERHFASSLSAYAAVFFAIWWAWMNFTWFASAYDTDDVVYRVLTLVEIAGALVIAAGVPAAFTGNDFVAVVVGYVVMRVALVTQWVRAAGADAEGRPVALRYAGGVLVVQALWIARLAVPHGWAGGVSFLALVAAELAVPAWAERSGRPTTWHPSHISERYGLFTLIVLGECVAAASNAVREAGSSGGISGALLVLAGAGLVLVFAIWWSYFDRPDDALAGAPLRVAFGWGYGHYLVFAALAGLGAGLEVALRSLGHQAEVSALLGAFAVGVPVTVYLLTLAALRRAVGQAPPRRLALVGAATVGVLLASASASFWPAWVAVLIMAAVMVAAVAIDVVSTHREQMVSDRGAVPSLAGR